MPGLQPSTGRDLPWCDPDTVSTGRVCPHRCFSRCAVPSPPSRECKIGMKPGRCGRFTALPAASWHHTGSKTAFFPGGVDNPLRARQPWARSLHARDGARASCPSVRMDSCWPSPITGAFLESKGKKCSSSRAAEKGFKNSSTAQRAFPQRA